MNLSPPLRRKLVFVLILISPVAAQAQKAIQEKCAGPIYTVQQVTRRARITQPLEIQITEDARAHQVHGRIVVEAVLCRTSRITDLRVTESLPYGMTENALEAVRRITFLPAEINWHTVSQRQRFEFLINGSGIGEAAAGDAVGRPVEGVIVMGNRRLSREEIFRWVHTRPGELYNQDQLTRDLNALFATGYFDRLRTRVTIEDGVRGGIVVTFEVVELPLITEVKFDGLKVMTEVAILDALLKENIDVRKGAVYDAAKVRGAVRVIRRLLDAEGQAGASVEVRTENITATTTVLTFFIR
jgi:Surface antigen variable number repeat/Gram-negative bacterial TonB protein C-terminal